MTPTEIITSLVGGTALTGVVAALSAWLGNVWATRIADAEKAVLEKEIERLKTELQFLSQIDLDLRTRRIPHYAQIWSRLKLLPKWPRNQELTYSDLQDLSKQLREWYFQEGGMFLSREAFDNGYRPLQEALTDIFKVKQEGLVSDIDYEQIRQRCSTLRTALTDDIQSRRRRFNSSSPSEEEPKLPTSISLQDRPAVGI
jgi:hypothetical protein